MFEFIRMSEEHINFYNEVRNLSRNNLHDNSVYSLEDNLKWFKKTNPEFYIIKFENHLIGYFRTSNLSLVNKNIYIGADLHPNYRGRGLAYKAYRQFISFIFNKYNLYKISLEVLENNIVAFNLYKKLGFKIDGVKREEVNRNDIYINSIIMSILRKEWKNE